MQREKSALCCSVPAKTAENNILELEKVIMKWFFSRKAVKKFKLNFDGLIGAYYQGVKRDGLHENAEVSWEQFDNENAETANGKPQLTGRRWLQFLDGAKEITRSTSLWGKGGELDVFKLAKKCGFDVKPYTDEYLDKVSHDPKYEGVFMAAKKEGHIIDGFSFPKKRKIFYNSTVTNDRKRFAIIHELSHFLLGHKGHVFCKVSGAPDSDHEYKEYNEEADKLAAILLMPHEYMRKNPEKSDEEIAKRFGVSEHAVKKRRKEVDIEFYMLRYGSHS